MQQAWLHAPLQGCGWVGGVEPSAGLVYLSWRISCPTLLPLCRLVVCFFHVPVLGQHCCGTGMQASLRRSVVPGILRIRIPPCL